MQSFSISLYLYYVKVMKHLLILALLGWTTAAWSMGETYAVIVSGGRSKMYNHERYWNDCAFLYSTLRQKYHLPKDHIILLMADGNNPANDMLRDGATGFASSPTDLDGDGQPDLMLAATRPNLDNTFYQLSKSLTSSDHLFIFITDHGECDSYGGVHLWLWGNGQLTPDELAAMVDQCHPATMNILLGQCYAGNFVEALQGKERIITAACTAGQMSWSCKNRPYDEFVYHWTCAIAGHDEQGQPISADQNGDGCISMDEAYNYACQYDLRPETPVLTAMPVGLASEWSFCGVQTDSGIIISIDENKRIPIYNLQGRMVSNH